MHGKRLVYLFRYLFEILSDYNRAYPDLEPPGLKLAFLRSPDTVILDIYHMMAELFDPPLSIQFFIDEDAAQTLVDEIRLMRLPYQL